MAKAIAMLLFRFYLIAILVFGASGCGDRSSELSTPPGYSSAPVGLAGWRLGVRPLPARRSQTGLFADLSRLEISPGVLPYEVNVPFWSDGAQKRRWIGLPPGGKLHFASTGEFDFPAGT